MMFTVISIELYKIFKKWRTYIGFIAIGILVSIVQMAIFFEGESSIDHMTRNLQQSFIFVGNLLNGYFVSYILLNVLMIHIPFLITLVAGDLLAGEATAGTYRLLITRPVSRTKLVTAKFIAGTIYSFLLVMFLALLSLGIGYLMFGFGELIVIQSSTVIIFERQDVFWRFILGYGFASLSMLVVTSLAFLFSSLVENAIGPIITTMAIIIVFFILSAINIDFFRMLRPYMFTTYLDSWRLFFDDPVDYAELLKSTMILLGHIVLLFGITLFLFRRKDILT